jgi:hypothetical protein
MVSSRCTSGIVPVSECQYTSTWWRPARGLADRPRRDLVVAQHLHVDAGKQRAERRGNPFDLAPLRAPDE